MNTVETSNAPDARYRLPRTVVPSRYDLVLEPDLGAATFAGSEEIVLEVRERVEEILLNAAELDIVAAWITGEGGRRIDVADVRLDPETERAHLDLPVTITPGTWTLHLGFRGVLNDRMCGFYRSTYATDDGVEHVIATTQFESKDARRAFPCWDEPDLKAVRAACPDPSGAHAVGTLLRSRRAAHSCARQPSSSRRHLYEYGRDERLSAGRLCCGRKWNAG